MERPGGAPSKNKYQTCLVFTSAELRCAVQLRRAGFQGQKLDTAEMFTRQFDQFKAANVFPQ